MLDLGPVDVVGDRTAGEPTAQPVHQRANVSPRGDRGAEGQHRHAGGTVGVEELGPAGLDQLLPEVAPHEVNSLPDFPLQVGCGLPATARQDQREDLTLEEC